MVSEILNVDDAAHYLKLSKFTIRDKAAKGELPAAKVGRQWRFSKTALDQWLAQGGTLTERAMDTALIAEVKALKKDGSQKWVPAEEVDAEYAK